MAENKIKGSVVSGVELEAAARQRARASEIIRVTEAELASKIDQGYIQDSQSTNGIRMYRPYEDWKLFENQVWLMMKRFGFLEMNSDSSFMLNLSQTGQPIWKQIDVLAKLDENVFVIECKHTQELQKKSLQDVIAEIVATQRDVENAIKKFLGDRTVKVTYILATKNIGWRDVDQRRISNAPRQIFVWADQTITYLEELAKLTDVIGEAARNQLFSILFPNRKAFVLQNQKVPAIKGKAGKWTYYSFVANPSQLLKICSVNRRVGNIQPDKAIEEASLAYQRMIRPKKIKEINNYIEKGNFFPNSIIITFDQEPQFQFASGKDLPFQLGYLELPSKYSSAWVLDGQHRLYGYANTSKVNTAPLPVIAFVKLPVKQQAKLFVEINQFQTPVDKNLLWDLAGDIYQGSDDPVQLEELTISNTVKILNLNKSSALAATITIPSHPGTGRANVTMTTICGAIKRNRLASSLDFFARQKTNFTQGEFEEYLAFRLIAFFNAVKKLYTSDWEEGDRGYLRSNNGISALVIMLKQILLFLNSREKQNLYTNVGTEPLEKELDRLLTPAIDYLKESPQRSADFRQRRGAAGQSECALELCQKIRDHNSDFPLPQVRSRLSVPDLPDNKEKAKETDFQKAVENTEVKLRTLVVEVLINKYGDEWYAKGLPESVRHRLNEQVNNRIANFPYLKRELMQNLEKRLQYSYVGDLLDTIVIKENWSLFEDAFGKKSNLEGHLKDFIALRNDKAHPREIDPVVWDKGIGAIRWIDRCIDAYYEESEDE